MRLLAATLSLGLVAASAAAQSTATLHGRVTDPQGAAVAGATITLRQTSTALER